MRTGDCMPRHFIERRIPWPRDRHWRPGEAYTLRAENGPITYRLRGVMRDPDPRSEWATLKLEPLPAPAQAKTELAEPHEPRRSRRLAG
ncbi:MAG: hypothetical protein ACRDGV_02600 [Candidatus Limnocylindria bacterium]